NVQLIVSNSAGCFDSLPASISITELLPPSVSVIQGSTIIVCENTSLTLSGFGALSYTWTGPIAVSDNTPVIAGISAAGNYTVTGIDANGCSGSATATVVVNAKPTAPFVSASTTSACAGESITLSASGTPNQFWLNITSGTTLGA
ncbi:MAG: hypothetical protein ACK4ON_14500, partial [Bacteroidia bacterium]